MHQACRLHDSSQTATAKHTHIPAHRGTSSIFLSGQGAHAILCTAGLCTCTLSPPPSTSILSFPPRQAAHFTNPIRSHAILTIGLCVPADTAFGPDYILQMPMTLCDKPYHFI